MESWCWRVKEGVELLVVEESVVRWVGFGSEIFNFERSFELGKWCSIYLDERVFEEAIWKNLDGITLYLKGARVIVCLIMTLHYVTFYLKLCYQEIEILIVFLEGWILKTVWIYLWLICIFLHLKRLSILRTHSQAHIFSTLSMLLLKFI